MKLVQVMIEDEEHEQLRQRVTADVSITSQVRDAIREYLERIKATAET